MTAVRQVGPVDEQYWSGEASGSSRPAVVPAALFLTPGRSVLPRDRQMAPLLGSRGLNSTCLLLGLEWECVELEKSHCTACF